MKRFLSHVTVTGADDSVKPSQLIELAAEFPFVEFGILLSRGAMGRPRFPSKKWITQLVGDCMGRGMNFAAHICGSWVREILLGRWPIHDLLNIDDDLMDPSLFKNFQLNTHASPHEVHYGRLFELLNSLNENCQTVIFQNDGVNAELITNAAVSNPNIAVLFDLSHGAGVLPQSWPAPLKNVTCGYAGGLSPENVAGQIKKIAQIVGDRQIWIDAETHLRSSYINNDSGDQQYRVDYFDMRKVRLFLEAAEPWVIQPERE